MKNIFVAMAATIAAAMSQINTEAVKRSAMDGIRPSRRRNRFTPRTRLPGAQQPAGTKIARLAAEFRIGKRA